MSAEKSVLGIIGSGNIGGAVARLAVAAGIDVVLSNSRSPETLSGLVAELGPRARAATPAEAAAAGDWTVVSIPFFRYGELPPLGDRIVIDTNNYYPSRDGDIPELVDGSLSVGEFLQKKLPGARIVKAFNAIYFPHLANLARPAGAPDRSALTIAGDDVEAKQSVTTLLDRLGYDTVDVGPMAESWRIRAGSPAYVLPYLTGAQFSPEDPGKPAGVQEVSAALAAARQADTLPHDNDLA
jgi:8-hydroxy-5-deazaflavin:NADPH oxidoreductase